MTLRSENVPLQTGKSYGWFSFSFKSGIKKKRKRDLFKPATPSIYKMMIQIKRAVVKSLHLT